MLLLHIGRGKAGSSTIQHTLLFNEDLLRAQNIILPETSKKHGGNSAKLAWALQSESSHNSPAVDEFSDMLARFPDHKIVVSSEYFFILKPSAITAIRDMTRGHSVQVLAYLREYPAWFPSLYGQATRTGKNLADFDAYFERGWKYSSAVEQLSNWADVFGWENVRVRSLDPASLTGGTLTQDLSSVLNTDLRGIASRNVSLHWIEIEFLRELYSANPTLRNNPSVSRDLQLVCARLRKCLDSIPSQTEYLSSEQWSLLAKLYAEDVTVITRKTGVPIPLPDPVVSTERPFLPSLAQAPKAVGTRFYDQSKSSFWAKLSPIVRDAVANVLSAWTGNPVRRYRLAEEKLDSGLASV